MGKVNTFIHAFNVGCVDKTALPRVDLERMRLAAEDQTNWLAKANGPMMLRPGLEYLGQSAGNAKTRLKEFVFGATDAALFEFGNQTLRVWVNDQVVTRPAVTAQVTNGDFSSATGWTLNPTAGAASTVAGGLLHLAATARGSKAQASQQVAVNQIGTEHALRIVVLRGPLTFRCGSTNGGDQYIAEMTLRTGTYSLAFTPTTASFFIQFISDTRPEKLVDSISVEASGVMSLPTAWNTASLPLMRFAGSADVVFVACNGVKQKRIERWSANSRSWAVVDYQVDDGPFTVDRTAKVKLRVDVTEGNGNLFSDSAFFRPEHIGSMFKLFGDGITQTFQLAGGGQYSEPFKVTGLSDVNYTYDDRNWYYTITGSWVGILRWYRSYDGKDSGYKPFPYEKDAGREAVDITSNQTNVENDDEDDNAEIWYKLGFADGTYTSGVANIQIAYDGGGDFGICRVIDYVTPTQVVIEVLKPFTSYTFTDQWNEGMWSATQGWPSAVCLSDGRLWWSGEDRIWASVSDAFESFDETVEGDAGPISRSIATGGVNDTQWMMSLQRLIIGTEGAISVAKSSSMDEPITPTNMSIRDSSTTGAAPIDPIKIDARGLFVERAGRALLEIVYDGGSNEYLATQLSKLTTELYEAGVAAVAVQRRPDTRMWCVMADGSCVCVVYEPDQNVLAFIPIVTDGLFESVAVLPSTAQDRVYFEVQRTVNGSPVRYIEKMALDTEVKPMTLCKVMDSFKVATPVAGVISGATHLAGCNVVVWADGQPLAGEFTVANDGTINLGGSYASAVYGLPYTARYKSSRLAYAASGGTAMLQKKTVQGVGLIMTDFVRKGLKVGHSVDDPYRDLYPLPEIVNGKPAPAIVSSKVHDEEEFPFPGEFSLDSRVCIECSSPNTASLLGLVVTVETNG
ncbi:hypothetical protein [Brucella intermedia]|uniref:hypothetical protein n=1 Tax=Brucella intermedia TaxID=94625 RepID=UPI001590472A|nr:hypothetical protein [Brucella intermedia]